MCINKADIIYIHKGLSTPGNIVWKQFANSLQTVSKQFANCLETMFANCLQTLFPNSVSWCGQAFRRQLREHFWVSRTHVHGTTHTSPHTPNTTQNRGKTGQRRPGARFLLSRITGGRPASGGPVGSPPNSPHTTARFLLSWCGPPRLTPQETADSDAWSCDAGMGVCVWCLSVLVHYFILCSDVL